MKHSKDVKKIVDKYLRWEYTKIQVERDGDYRYLGLTNVPLGPPVSLGKALAEEWKKRMGVQLKSCITDILLPYQQEVVARGMKNFGDWKEERLSLGEESQVNRQVKVGVERAKLKWKKRGYDVESKIVQLEEKRGDRDIGEIDKLKRGEVDRGEGAKLFLDSKLGANKDLYKVVALSIYGKSKLRKLVFRCINKYMNMYEDRESSSFIPHWGKLCNGEKKWLNSWYMQRALIHNRDLCFSCYELNIISMLYDVNIRVYADDLQCLWKTSRKNSRVINILSGMDNTWTLLEFQCRQCQKVRMTDNSWGNSNKFRWPILSSDIDMLDSSSQSNSPVQKLEERLAYSQFSRTDSDSQGSLDSNIGSNSYVHKLEDRHTYSQFSKIDSDSQVSLDSRNQSNSPGHNLEERHTYSQFSKIDSGSQVSLDSSYQSISPIHKLEDRHTYSQFSKIDTDSQISIISTQSGRSVINSDNSIQNNINNHNKLEEGGTLRADWSSIDRERSNFELDGDLDESKSKISIDDNSITVSGWSEITVDVDNKAELEEIHKKVSKFYERVSVIDKDKLADRFTYAQFSQIDSDSQLLDNNTQRGGAVRVNNNENRVQNSLNTNRVDNGQKYDKIGNYQKGWSVIDSENSSLKLDKDEDESKSKLSLDSRNSKDLDENDSIAEIELEEIRKKVIQFYKNKEGSSMTYSSVKKDRDRKVTDGRYRSNNKVKNIVDKDSLFSQITLDQDRIDDNNNSDNSKIVGDRTHTRNKFHSRETTPQLVETKGNLDWIIIAANTEDLGELSNIESNINKLGILEGKRLNLSNITFTTDRSEDSEKIALQEENDRGNLEASGRNGVEVEHKSDVSYSSIDDDIKWLFLDKEVAEKHRNQDLEEVDEERIVGSCNGYNIKGRVSATLLENKASKQRNKKVSKRRNFWCKWRNKIRSKERNSNRKKDRNLYKVGIQQKSIEAVFDYSSRGLDRTEIELLSKGSTFCITNNRIDEDRFKADIYAYSRRLRLHEEYREQSGDVDFSQVFSEILHNQNQSQITDDISQIDRRTGKKTVGRRLPSMYDPESQNRNLARYVNCIQEESIIAINTKINFKDNLSKEHRVALKTLKQKVEDRIIVITLADKGSGIVVVDYDKYVEKGTDYIEREAKAYSITNKPHKQIILEIVKERNKIVKKLREVGVIEVETATYCMKQLEEKVTGMKFYYKVHKDTKIDTMPLRPLQSCIGAPTQHLSQVLTDLLQPFLNSQFIPTFIQDSNQLLYRLESLGPLDESSTLISSDVAALYPSIPHQEGLMAVETFLVESSSFNDSQIKYIMLALKLVITQNFVMWNGNIYSQDSGVAMGTPVAVAYANIFMHWIDTQLKQRASFIIEHIRYIDDNLFIIPEDKIEETMSIANTILTPHIRFTYEKLDKLSDIGLPFLDTQLFISNTQTIISRLYTKKTDKHTYLLPSSFHPSHITKNIPQAVFNRIRRICSTIDWFRVDAAKAMQWLEDRG